jgi:hypothetical protein
MTREITREEILAMSAGVEMDMLIELELFGKVASVYYHPRPFSTDLSAAWEVVEKMKQNNWFFILSDNLFPDRWEASFFWDPNQTMIEAIAETAPLAICRAALRVAMEETP